MNINLKVRIKQPIFWVGLIGVILSPILAYFGLAYSDLTSWSSLGDILVAFIQNPFLIGTVLLAAAGFLGVLVDPTTKGLGDSQQALQYEKPKE
jgi:phi LC3 family holin